MISTKYWWSTSLIILLVAVSHGTAAQHNQHIYVSSVDLNRQEAQVQVIAEGTSLQDILSIVEKKYDISFLFDSKLVSGKKASRKYVLNFDRGLYDMLEVILAEFEVTYKKLTHRTLGIVSKQEEPVVAPAQEQISGTVTDAQNGETLPGVNILVKGTTTGTFTDNEGNFELTVESLQDTLVVSYIGYQNREIPIDGRTEIDITLQSQTISGEEMVVVGYGEQTKETVTSSITNVTGESIARVHAGNVGNALAGVSPGLQITQRSGQPGQSTPEIFLRGVSSLSRGNAQPIYVVDGVIYKSPTSFTELDPNNVDNISVLKDASATAIYGSEGANGAIVVTTKRGTEGPMHISISSSAGLQSPVNMPEMTDAYTTAIAYNTAQKNDGIPENERRFSQTVLGHFKSNDYPLIFPNTNWRSYLTKKRTLQTRTNVNVSGGTDKLRYFISGGYLRQNGYYKNFPTEYETKVNPNYDRYNFRANLDIDVTPSTELSLTTGGRLGKRLQTNRSGKSLRYEILSGSPFSSPGIIDGKLIQINNRYIPGGGDFTLPLLYYYGTGFIEHSQNVLNMQLSLNQDLKAITKGLEFQVKGNYNSNFTRSSGENNNGVPLYRPFFLTDLVDNPPAGEDSTVVFRKEGSFQKPYYAESFSKDRDWYVEARLNYKQNFGPHNVEGLLLFNQRRNYYPNAYRGIPEGRVSGLTRLNYNFKRRYLLQFSLNTDGSERYAKDQRFGYFPAVSAGWILTNEPYMPDLNFLSFLKLKGSYGIVGSDRGIGRFLYLADQYNLGTEGYNFGIGSPQDLGGASEGSLGNPFISWSEAKKLNFGVDLRLFQDKLSFSLEYFHQRRTGSALNKYTPAYIPVALPPVNAGKIENHGYESSIEWEQHFGDFSYSIEGNVTFATNKVIYNNEIPPLTPWQGQKGRPVGQHFGYKFDGYYSQDDIDHLGNGVAKPSWSVEPGYLKFKDIDGDGKINEKDKIPIGYPSSPPEYAFGSTQQFSYKNIDLTMTWAGATNVSRNLTRTPFRSPFGEKGRAPAMQWQWDGRWTPEKAASGQKIEYPVFSEKQTLTDGSRSTNDSDFWLVDASYIRLKTIELGYNFSNRALQKIGLQSLRVYLNGYNLLTFSGMLDKYDIDPGQVARSNRTNYPVMKNYNLGINVQF